MHQQHAYQHLYANTQAEQKKIEQLYGAKYSILYELPYYDAVRFLVLDAMHILYLGIAKHTTELWFKLGILLDSQRQTIQDRVNRLVVPQSIGRLPKAAFCVMKSENIYLTADQWKNCFFSLYTLHGLLPPEHIDCWSLFVEPCQILGHRSITRTDCIIVHEKNCCILCAL